MLVEENVSRFAPPKHPKVAKFYSDMVTVQAKGVVQLHFHVLKNTLSLVLLWLKVQGSRFFIIRHIHNHTSIISSEMQVELKKNTALHEDSEEKKITPSHRHSSDMKSHVSE